MREVFKGWRRKVGVVTLALSLALMAGWIRSQIYSDFFNFPRGTVATNVLISSRSSIGYCRLVQYVMKYGPEPIPFGCGLPLSVGDHPIRNPMIWERRFGGFAAWQIGQSNEQWNATFVLVPYWSVVLPLTLLSAYLFLWKPRKRVQAPIDMRK